MFVTGLPGLYYRLIKTDGNSRTLANPHLRTSDGLPSAARFGDDVPVPTVTFAPIASGGVNQQPITSFTYRTVGVNIDITPRLHHDDDISLAVEARSEQPVGRRVPEPADLRHALRSRRRSGCATARRTCWPA